MIYFTDEMIDRLIKEDVPYVDLTTTVLKIGKSNGIIEFRVRENGVVEVENIEEAIKLAKIGVDGIQFDKIPFKDLTDYVKIINHIDSNIMIIAAGGINFNNIEQFAQTGVNTIATSSLFHGKPLDIGTKIETKI